MFELNITEHDKSSDDVINEINRIKKTDTILIEDILLNPLNPVLDSDEEIKIFADKIYHCPEGVIENITVYRLSNGKYMLLSGHKRILACKYNLEHESELDGTGNVQKTVLANILKQPLNELDELNLILDFNDYRRLERFEQKYEVFLKYYHVVAVMVKNNQFKGRIREYISVRSGLGLKTVGECINTLKENVYQALVSFCDELNSNNTEYGIEDKYEYLKKETNLPDETLHLVLSKLNIDKLRKKETKKQKTSEVNKRFERLSADVSNILKINTTIRSNKNITIKCDTEEQLKHVLKLIGYSEKNID